MGLDITQIQENVEACKECSVAIHICYLHDFLNDHNCDLECQRCNFNSRVSACGEIVGWA